MHFIVSSSIQHLNAAWKNSPVFLQTTRQFFIVHRSIQPNFVHIYNSEKQDIWIQRRKYIFQKCHVGICNSILIASHLLFWKSYLWHEREFSNESWWCRKLERVNEHGNAHPRGPPQPAWWEREHLQCARDLSYSNTMTVLEAPGLRLFRGSYRCKSFPF